MSTKTSTVTDPNTGASFLAQIAVELNLAPRNVAAAAQLHCSILYSEDLPHGHEFEGIRVINPFNAA